MAEVQELAEVEGRKGALWQVLRHPRSGTGYSKTYKKDSVARGSFTIERIPGRSDARILVGTLLLSNVPLIAR